MNCAVAPIRMVPEAGCNFSHVAPPLFACQVSRRSPPLLTMTDMTGLLPCSIFPKSRFEGFASSFAAGTIMLKCSTALRELMFSFARIVCRPWLQLVLTGSVVSKVPLPLTVIVLCAAYVGVNCSESDIDRVDAGECWYS